MDTKRHVDTAVIVMADRFTPPSMVTGAAKALEASGVVDILQTADQLSSFFPRSLWTPANAPLAKLVPDLESHSDAITLAAWCLAAASKLGIAVTTDAIRRGPAELTQTMLTLAGMTERSATLMVGAGEVKQTKPFGWKRAEGLTRMEDLFRGFSALLNAEGPIDLQGNHMTFDGAWLGAAQARRPRLWGLGGGPKLIDLSTTYGDGVAGSAPNSWATPEQAAAQIAEIKRALGEKGRDPEAFGIGLFFSTLIHEDANVIDRALDNPLARWFAAVTGRVEPQDWRTEGIEPAVPEGWTYFLKMLPNKVSPEFASETVGRTTRRMADRSFLVGSPAEVAAQMQPYIDAGVNLILPFDVLPLMLAPDDAAQSLQRAIDVCAAVKQTAASPAEIT